MTPFMLALFKNMYQLARLLEEKMLCQREYVNIDGKTARAIASQYKYRAVIQYLGPDTKSDFRRTKDSFVSKDRKSSLAPPAAPQNMLASSRGRGPR